MSLQWLLLLGTGMVLGAFLTLGGLRYSRKFGGSRKSPENAEHDHLAQANPYGLKSLGILVVSLVLVAGAIIYSGTREGVPQTGPQSLAPGMAGSDNRNLADVDTMIDRLSARLESDPDDGEGFRMLGWAYLMTDRPDEALGPYLRAVALLPGDVSALTGLGEALTAVNDGTVSGEALARFNDALALEPSDIRARYFVAKFDYQNGRKQQALDDWIDLAQEAPADAAWQEDIRRDIALAASDLGIDVSDRLEASGSVGGETGMPVLDQRTIEAASRLPAAEQEAMVNRMVDGLAARLAANPNDAAGWERLIRSRMVLGEDAQAARDLATARQALAGNGSGLARVNATASELGVR